MEIEIRKSKRKTISITVTQQGGVIVRAPYRTPDGYIQRVLEKRASWIAKHLAQAAERRAREPEPELLTGSEEKALRNRAKAYIPGRVELYAARLGVEYRAISIRMQKTRWGSCSIRGNLNFNALLMLTPPEIIDYVVVHELCHLKEMNHSPKFWAEVAKILPDYRARQDWLNAHGSRIIARKYGRT